MEKYLKFSSRQLIIGFIVSFVLLTLSAIFGEIVKSHTLKIICMVIAIFFWFLGVGRNLFFLIMDLQIKFHQKYNQKNLDKFPVSWVIKNEMKIKKAISLIILAGTLFTATGIIINE